MRIEHVVTGPLQTNSYLVYDDESKDAMVIDPGDEAGRIMRLVEKLQVHVRYIVCTHAHFDHVGAVLKVRERTGAAVVMNSGDLEIFLHAHEQAAFWEYEIEQPPEPDRFVVEGEVISVGRLTFRVLHTPGHSPGSICLYGHGVVFTGDTVFAGSVGRTDFPGGSIEELRVSFKTIIDLPPETRIFPGHGDASTVGLERQYNFFMSEI